MRSMSSKNSLSGWMTYVIPCCIAVATWGGSARGQDLPLTQSLSINQLAPLDPTRNLTQPVLESSGHTPLLEEYIWTASDRSTDDKVIYTFPKVTEQVEPHYFRERFEVKALSKQATLYIAGPRRVKVWINGQMAEEVESDVTSPLGMHVFTTDVTRYLRMG